MRDPQKRQGQRGREGRALARVMLGCPQTKGADANTLTRSIGAHVAEMTLRRLDRQLGWQVVVRYRGKVARIYFRADAGFVGPL